MSEKLNKHPVSIIFTIIIKRVELSFYVHIFIFVSLIRFSINARVTVAIFFFDSVNCVRIERPPPAISLPLIKTLFRWWLIRIAEKKILSFKLKFIVYGLQKGLHQNNKLEAITIRLFPTIFLVVVDIVVIIVCVTVIAVVLVAVVGVVAPLNSTRGAMQRAQRRTSEVSVLILFLGRVVEIVIV